MMGDTRIAASWGHRTGAGGHPRPAILACRIRPPTTLHPDSSTFAKGCQDESHHVRHPEGGSGKSTLCISLAVAAQERGLSVCILEMDRQATISDWLDHRTAEGPEVAQIDATQIEGVMAQLRDSAYDYVFIDTPGVDSAGTLSAIRAADLCIIPCRPTPADLRAFKPTLAAIYRLEKKFAFVLNQTPRAPTASAKPPTASPFWASCPTSTSSPAPTTRMPSASVRASPNTTRRDWPRWKCASSGTGSSGACR